MNRAGNEGFVLIEVLVAATILAAACLFLTRSLTQSVRSLYAAQDYYRAGLLVESFLWDLDHPSDRPAPSVESIADLKNSDWKVDQKMAWKGNLDRWEGILSWGSSPSRKEALSLSAYSRREPS